MYIHHDPPVEYEYQPAHSPFNEIELPDDLLDDNSTGSTSAGNRSSDAISRMDHWTNRISLLASLLIAVAIVIIGVRSPSKLIMAIGILVGVAILFVLCRRQLRAQLLFAIPSISFVLLLLIGFALPRALSHSYSEKGKICFDQQNYECAIAHFDSAIKFDSTNARTLSQRGHAQRENGNYDKALSDYDEALRLGPKDAGTLYYRAWIENELGDFDNAILDLDEAISLDPNAWNFYYERAYAYLKNGDTQKAVLDYLKTISIAGDDDIELKNKVENIILTIVPSSN